MLPDTPCDQFMKANMSFGADTENDSTDPGTESTRNGGFRANQEGSATSGSTVREEVREKMSLAAEMNELGLKERENALYDIHGVTSSIEETPEMVDRMLSELEASIQQERQKRVTGAYDMAESTSPHYVGDRGLRLKFLRADNFDAKKAAKHMLDFFEYKLELFGPSKLCKDITLDDLSSDDIECLENGQFQLMPTRDQAGRAVLVMAIPHIRYREIENQARATFYVFMAAVEDEETQKKGVVIVTYRVAPTEDERQVKVDPRLPITLYTMMKSWPFRVQGWHVCTESNIFADWFQSLRQFSGQRERVRTRMHIGTHVECVYLLLTFGIPVKQFPLNEKGELKKDRHIQWLEARRKHEETHSLIGVPNQGDILFGRGRPTQEHTGNLRLKLILEALLPKYDSSTRLNKPKIAQAVVDEIRRAGGRFLKPVGGMWVEVEDLSAQDKVAHTFRSIRSDLQKKKSKANNRRKSPSGQDAFNVASKRSTSCCGAS